MDTLAARPHSDGLQMRTRTRIDQEQRFPGSVWLGGFPNIHGDLCRFHLLSFRSFGRLQDGSRCNGVRKRCADAYEQLGERVAHTHQSGARGGAVVDYVEPVPVAEIACLGPLVVAHFDATTARAALDLDTAAFAMG